MSKVGAIAALFVAVLCIPLLPALVVAGAAGAAGATSQATASSTWGCGGAVGAAGAWRPPFLQPYTVSPRGIGMRYHPIFKRWTFHGGQDMSSQPGPGPVVAITAGRVVRAGWDLTGYGNVVDLQHADGIQTRYAHLASIEPDIAAGADVAIGQRLGVEGSTGASTGNHLHFEVIVDSKRVDPLAFMRARGVPLDGRVVTASPNAGTGPAGTAGQGPAAMLPPPGAPRLNSLHNPPLPIPDGIRRLYTGAGRKYAIPWYLLAGIGMEETAHGRLKGTSSAGARGIMQFMPATWATVGVDGDGDHLADITNDADSIYSAAHYLVRSGATRGIDGVRQSLFAYNHADWYVNDVLRYAEAYRTGTAAVSNAASCTQE